LSRTARTWVASARVALSLLLLWVVSRYVDVGEVLSRLGDLSPGWVAAALALSVLQVALLAWRWRFTAARLGIDLPYPEALGEYYLGILLNQILPGGVTGDVSRAWRHARTGPLAGPAVRAVVLERVSAQVVMTSVAAVSVLVLPWASGVARAAVGVATVVLLATTLRWLLRRHGSDTHRALLAREVVVPQLVSAVLVVGSYIAVFIMAARAIGLDTPLATLLPLPAPVLMTMLIPVTVAGWGIREAAAAALWGFAGLTPEDGAAVSVAYGLLVLASSAPGLVVLMRYLIAGRGRRARPPRA
jgi:uncharacterized membrane protein YbhN (UPF0104 family)